MIAYDSKLGQLYDDKRGQKLMGRDLLYLLVRFTPTIEAGQILCYKGVRTTIMFQLLSEVKTITLKESTLLAYEPGSVIGRYSSDVGVIPAFTFRKIFIPDKVDIGIYNNRKTI